MKHNLLSKNQQEDMYTPRQRNKQKNNTMFSWDSDKTDKINLF